MALVFYLGQPVGYHNRLSFESRFFVVNEVALLKKIANYWDDLLLVLGCVCILVGLALFSAVATWIAAGAMLIAFGVLVGKAKAKKNAAANLTE